MAVQLAMGKQHPLEAALRTLEEVFFEGCSIKPPAGSNGEASSFLAEGAGFAIDLMGIP